MSHLININPIDDPFYRYKMPSLVVKTSKNFTTLENLPDISKSLDRNSEFILKYFGSKLGTQINVSKKCINGNHSRDKLQSMLQNFIDEFVLCKDCLNPETKIIFVESYSMECSACGSVNILKDDKLLKYSV